MAEKACTAWALSEEHARYIMNTVLGEWDDIVLRYSGSTSHERRQTVVELVLVIRGEFPVMVEQGKEVMWYEPGGLGR